MKIEKGHYVPKELITSEAVHEAVVKCFVAAGFKDRRPMYGNFKRMESFAGLSVDNQGEISWGDKGSSAKEPLTLQQLFTAENGLQWTNWAVDIRHDLGVIFTNGTGTYAPIGHPENTTCSYSVISKAKILATRQPKEKEVKTIKDAVMALNGKLPDENEQGCFRAICAAIYYVEGDNGIRLGSFEEFEATVKRMGYINGYRWGVEYPTNGKRPELPDTLFVKYQHKTDGEWLSNPFPVDGWAWEETSKAFKIVDEAYKPADTNYLNALTQTQSLTHSDEGLTHSEWWDYENDKAISCPPAGAEVEIIEDCYAPLSEFGQTFLGQKCVVMSSFKNKHGFDIISVEKPDGECCCFVLRLVRPLDHATHKAGMERKRVIDAAVSAAQNFDNARSFSEVLYDSGMLVMPK